LTCLSCDTTYPDKTRKVFSVRGAPQYGYGTQRFTPNHYVSGASFSMTDSLDVSGVGIISGSISFPTQLVSYDSNNVVTQTDTGSTTIPGVNISLMAGLGN
jgi:hypothetical protein